MNGKVSTNRRFFTLFEMLIVMLLITTCFGVIAVQIPKALKKERFETAVEVVIDKINLAQELILDHLIDVTLILTEQENGIRCQLKVDQPLPKRLKGKVEKETLLTQIDTIGFEKKLAREVDLRFDATLGATPRGRLFLKSKNQSTVLILRGYPSKVLREDYNFAEEKQAPYPEEILSSL